MVPKLLLLSVDEGERFRAVLFRMVPKQWGKKWGNLVCFRAVLFRMVPKFLLYDITEFF